MNTATSCLRAPTQRRRARAGRRAAARRAPLGLSGLLLVGCSGPQSALAPVGAEAAQVLGLFWAMLAGAALIWLAVVGLAVYAACVRPGPHGERSQRALIAGGGVVLPVVVLTGLLVWALALMPALRAPGDGLRIEVSGEQWWWRVRYWPADGGPPVTSANLIRLPVGHRTELVLGSPDVIHSLWIPSLAGKVDMIPGRTTRLVVEPTATGSFRGQCAEFCGTAHALMALPVDVLPRADFEAWLAATAAPAEPPQGESARAGARLFLELGCGGCHTVRGTPADGTIGPDLTHFGGRATIGAGILPNTPAALARWIAETDRVKPGVEMPTFGMLPETELGALVAYLQDLK